MAWIREAPLALASRGCGIASWAVLAPTERAAKPLRPAHSYGRLGRPQLQFRLVYGTRLKVGPLLILALGLAGACTPTPAADSTSRDKSAASKRPTRTKKLPVRARRANWQVPDVVTANFKVPAQAQIAAAWTQAETDGRDLVVYVGANWCEPCKLFLRELRSEKFAPHLADYRFLKFDRDMHRDELADAGYGKPTMIPHFAIPTADGRASGQSLGQPIKKDKHFRILGRKLDKMIKLGSVEGEG